MFRKRYKKKREWKQQKKNKWIIKKKIFTHTKKGKTDREEENMRRDQVVWFGGLIRLRVRSLGNPDTKTCQLILIGFEKEERIEVKRIIKKLGERILFFFLPYSVWCCRCWSAAVSIRACRMRLRRVFSPIMWSRLINENLIIWSRDVRNICCRLKFMRL